MGLRRVWLSRNFQYPGFEQVAVFDTAFHQTMPPRAYTYALPQQICEEHHIRRYGAHGTSYRFLVKKTAQVGHLLALLYFIPLEALLLKISVT